MVMFLLHQARLRTTTVFSSLILRRSEVARSLSREEGVRASDLGPYENQAMFSLKDGKVTCRWGTPGAPTHSRFSRF